MASSSPGSNLHPSEAKSLRLRLISLIIDGGTVVLRPIFDKKFPPQTLKNDLRNPTTRSQIHMLIQKKIIDQIQETKLYPTQGDPCSSNFDITLLTCLLRNICGFAKPWDNVWDRNPLPTDLRVEADITRLRDFRNELSHLVKLDMSRNEFEIKWKEIESVLIRLGSTLPDLKTDIEALYNKSIDPDMERHYNEVIEQLKEQDTAMRSQMSELRADVDQQKRKLQELQASFEIFKSSTPVKSANGEGLVSEELQPDGSAVTVLDTSTSSTSLQSEKREEHGDAKCEGLIEMFTSPFSSELSLLIDISEDFFKRNNPGEFVQTTTYREIKNAVDSQVLLYGKPGEGKTTIGVQLMNHEKESHVPKFCVKVTTPNEFSLAIRSGKIIAILIDDIFGHGIVDKELVKIWQHSVADLLLQAKSKEVRVVITSDERILSCVEMDFAFNGFESLKRLQVSSEKLSRDERLCILKAHLRSQRRSLDVEFMAECVSKSQDVLQQHSLTFGFPRCANMFASNNNLFKLGSGFFSEPVPFVRSCLKDINQDMAQFLPLAIMWALPEQRLKKEALASIDIRRKTKEVHDVAKRFGFPLKGNKIRKLRRSLDNLQGFFTYNPSDGYYRFFNETVADVVGQVLSQDFIDVVLEKCKDEFLIKYTTVNSSKKELDYIYVEKHLFRKLGHRLLNLFFSTHTVPVTLSEFNYNHTSVLPELKVNISVFRHDAFTNSSFVRQFIHLLSTEQRQILTTCPVWTMSGDFLGDDIDIGSPNIYIPSYILLLKHEMLFRRLWRYELFPVQPETELGMALLVAVRMGQKRCVDFLISLGLQINDNHVYIAALNGNAHIINSLLSALKEKAKYATQTFKMGKDNHPLIVATQKGHVEAVKCLVNHRVDLNVRNSEGFSAIDKAVLSIHPPHRHEETFVVESEKARQICTILVAAGAIINTKAGEFRRTPLHTAADIGDIYVVQLLLNHGADTRAEDLRRQYPIHCALFRGNDDVALLLLQHDPSLAKVTFQGMTLAHIACLKSCNAVRFLEELQNAGVNLNLRDHTGRTPLYIAAWNGYVRLVEFLLDKVDITIPNTHGYTPLHAAVNRGNRWITKLLYPRVDINVQDNDGKTALHVACEKRHYDIIEDMVTADRNIDMHILTQEGKSVFDILDRNQ